MSLNFEKTDLIGGNILTIITDEGTKCISEEGANDTEKAMFAEFRAKYPNGKPKVVDMQSLIEAKVKSLSEGCNKTITTEFMSDVDGTMKNYDFELENQVNMSEMAGEVKDAKRDGVDLTNVKISYYAKGESCHDYTAEQFLTLAAQGKTFK